MRGLGLFFGSKSRNDPVRLENPHPLPVYANIQETGDAGKDGFTILSKANPDYAGKPPLVGGTPTYRGPDNSFEQ